MAEKAFKLEIITPRRVVFDGEVVSFSAPGVVGGFQVLYNHAPMLAAIGVGEVKVKEPQAPEIRYATSGGFVEVRDNRVVLLAETLERSGEIDRARAETARDKARTTLSGKCPEEEMAAARAALERALNRIRIAQKR